MQSKICNSCGELKDLNYYSKAKSNLDGYSNKCKPCVVQRNKTYYRTKEGIKKLMFRNMNVNSKARGHVLPSFDSVEFNLWLDNQDFNKLYSAWVSSGYTKELKPSVDRKDSVLPYEFANMRLVSWDCNNEAAYKERKNGRTTQQTKQIQMLNLNGELICTYPSISKAARDNNFCRTNINYCLKGGREEAHGYKWCYS